MNRRDFLKTASVAAAMIPITSVVAEPSVEPMSVVKTKTLKMFHNGIDTVICEDVEDAQYLVAKQYYGNTAGTAHPFDRKVAPEIWGYYRNYKNQLTDIYLDEVNGVDDWYEYDMDMEFHLWEDHPGDNEIVKKVSEWIEEHGRGYFACTEY